MNKQLLGPFYLSRDCIILLCHIHEQWRTFAIVPIDITYQDATLEVDTFFGVNNKTDPPIRQVESITIKGTQEMLFAPDYKVVEIANWQILILLTSIFFIGLVKAFSSTRFNLGLKALLSYSVAQEITREEKVLFHRSNLFFTAIHLFTTALFIFQFRQHLNSGEEEVNSFSFFLLILAFISGMYAIKYFSFRLISFTFNDFSIAPEYIFNVSLYNGLQGTILIPILCISYFTDILLPFVLVYIAVPSLFFVFLLRLFRLFKIGSYKGVSYVYIFVYICSLEILPLVVLYRILIH